MALAYILISANIAATLLLVNFATKGERFTADDGRALEKRIEKLENEIKPTL